MACLSTDRMIAGPHTSAMEGAGAPGARPLATGGGRRHRALAGGPPHASARAVAGRAGVPFADPGDADAARRPAPGGAVIGPAWRGALAAAVAGELAAGILAGAVASRTDPGDRPVMFFAVCAFVAGLADMAMIPGWLWAPERLAPWTLLFRGLASFITLGFACLIGLAVAFLGGISLAGYSWLAGAGFVACFAAAGAAAGLGAKQGELLDRRPGMVRGRLTSHLVGGVAGTLIVLEAAALVSPYHEPVRGGVYPLGPWWSWLLAPGALALGGGLHHWLLARDAARAGTAPPPVPLIRRRAAMLCGGCVALSAVVMVLA